MNNIYSLPIESDDFPEIVPVFIEIPKHSKVKYEWDNDKNCLVLDRILHSSVMYPENYGFIPQTICKDGDPLDVLIFSNHTLQPGTIVDVRPICYMDMTDEKGQDEKVLAVIDKEPYFKEISDINDISIHKLKEIKEFFDTYKNLEKNKWTKIEKWNNKEATMNLIKKTHNDYLKSIIQK